ncbi:MAG: tRNA lysidine(34) synthetase TilS [Clostridia bacterium]|nr:tRNA lysidine(34) synthetase TilS [Clostridia bacterium]
MKPELSGYKNLKICVAVSGGRDSMALLHYLCNHAKELNVTLTALNCDHQIRGERSAADSLFVKNWCFKNGVPLLTYKCDCIALAQQLGVGIEEAARSFRRNCYFAAAKEFNADCIATAHHLNDNAETVLFNLARGASVGGVKGIYDTEINKNGQQIKLIRPLISCSRQEINEYIKLNNVPYVEDETNRSEDYTRNYIRINVLPALEKAVPEAVKSIYRFSRLAAEDEEFIRSEMQKRNLLYSEDGAAIIKTCESRALFSRAAIDAIKVLFGKKDYTSDQIETLYNLQFAENGKSFNFLGLTAQKEQGAVSVFAESVNSSPNENNPLTDYLCGKRGIFGGQPLKITVDSPQSGIENAQSKILKFDLGAVPQTAVVRTMREGDKFTKFGGGTKKLCDYFTDKKIPQRLRLKIPLIATDTDILAVCGVEISDKIKIKNTTKTTAYIICKSYAAESGTVRKHD